MSMANCWCADQETFFIQGLSNVTLVCGNFTGAARNQNVGVDGINTGVAGRLLVRGNSAGVLRESKNRHKSSWIK